MILNLPDLPSDPAHRLLYLSGVKQAVQTELDEEFAAVYAQLRREGRLAWAIGVGLHGKKRILALTRQWNRSQARMIRWNDGMDKTSTVYAER